MDEKKWFAVHTKPRYEKRVIEVLSRKKIESYCPTNKVLRQWSDRKKLVTEPLFPYFVFVKMSESEHLSLKQIDGVNNFVYWLGKPVIILDFEIAAIRQFLEQHHSIRLEKTNVNVNGADQADGKYGNDVIMLKTKSVRVELPSLGYSMIAEMETTDGDLLVQTIGSKIKLSYFKYAFK